MFQTKTVQKIKQKFKYYSHRNWEINSEFISRAVAWNSDIL